MITQEAPFYICLGNYNIKTSVDNFILKLGTSSARRPATSRQVLALKNLRDFLRLRTISQHRLTTFTVFPLSPTAQSSPYVAKRAPRAFVLLSFYVWFSLNLSVNFSPFIFIRRTNWICNDSLHFRVDEHSNEFLINRGNGCVFEKYFFSF